MKNESNEPQPLTGATSNPDLRQTPTLIGCRHDGWTGDKMAAFCEALAETGIVMDACDAAGMSASSAYRARRRDPVFAAAWDAALMIARERLADALLARSLEGNVEQIYRDGELVGERHVIDNRLGLAILRRLDRLAETGLSTSRRGERPAAAPAPSTKPLDLDFMLDALRTGDPDDIAEALAQLGSEVHEVHGPPVPLNDDSLEDTSLDLTDRCWRDGIEQMWMTDFPPPDGFAGYESRDYDEIGNAEPYERVCTPEEAAILDADEAAARAAERAEDADLRDCWFQLLKDDLPAAASAGGGG
jgi:hypothetical protein